MIANFIKNWILNLQSNPYSTLPRAGGAFGPFTGKLEATASLMQAVTSSSLLRFPATSSTLTGSIMAAGFMLDPGGNLLPMPALPTPSPVTSENQCSICSHPSCTGGSACLLSFCSCYFMLYLHFLQLLLVVISWFHLVFVSYGLFCLYTFNLVAIGYPLVFPLSISSLV